MSVVVERHVTPEQFEKVRGSLAAKNFYFTGNSGSFEAVTKIGRVAGAFQFKDGVLRVEVTKHGMGFGKIIKSQIDNGIDEAIAS